VTPGSHRVVVDCRADASAFAGFAVEDVSPEQGNTALTVDLRERSALEQLFRRIRELDLTLLEYRAPRDE
jgi:hypothetical protein